MTTLCRRGEEVLLGASAGGDAGRNYVQCLRADGCLRQLSGRCGRERTSRAPAGLPRGHRLQHEPRQEVSIARRRTGSNGQTSEEASTRIR